MIQEAEAEEHFERMQQASGMGNKLELVDAYVTAEAANFELFNQVAGINAQAAELQDLIVQQQATVGRLRSAHVVLPEPVYFCGLVWFMVLCIVLGNM